MFKYNNLNLQSLPWQNSLPSCFVQYYIKLNCITLYYLHIDNTLDIHAYHSITPPTILSLTIPYNTVHLLNCTVLYPVPCTVHLHTPSAFCALGWFQQLGIPAGQFHHPLAIVKHQFHLITSTLPRAECNIKYRWQNYFLTIQLTNRGLFTEVAWNVCHKAMVVRWPLLDHCWLRK